MEKPRSEHLSGAFGLISSMVTLPDSLGYPPKRVTVSSQPDFSP